jgi:hypothetical protein
VRRLTVLLATILAAATAVLSGVPQAATAASRTAATGPSWSLAYSTHFATPVPLGGFSGCSNWGDDTCTGLPKSLQSSWWAYPSGWPDTATERSYPVGGFYQPQSTVWISGGQMHIRMYRGASGPVNSAALVPKASIDQLYGKYVETWRVSKVAAGYKSAHLLWPHGNANFEVDYPEDEWDTSVCAFVHADSPQQQSFCPGTTWGAWHTTQIRWQPGSLTFFMDGKQVGSTTQGVPNVPMDWIIQNESALNGESAAPSSSAQMDISYVAYYAWHS